MTRGTGAGGRLTVLVPPGARVKVVEVGPRDGLQNEAAAVSTADKIAFIDQLSAAGLPVVEIGAFVSPTRVPQMADALDVARGVSRRPGTVYTALVPNLAGLARALEGGMTDVALFAAATETFSRRNINRGIDESFQTYRDVAREARAAGLAVRGYLSVCFGCPFEGDVPPDRVADLARRMADLGVYEVVLSDTIGSGHPGLVLDVLGEVARAVPIDRLGLHMHDTRGTGLANVLAGLAAGVRTFDASAGGLGGCPFAPGAAGNLATEDLVAMLDGLRVDTGVRLADVVEASARVERTLGHPLPSRVYQAERRRAPRAPAR